jgi:cation diffusion facilitator CzcD-associated flavoprotein CzcO
MTLELLEQRIRSELPYVDFPARAWMRPPSVPDAYDVAIVGGGQSGLAAAFGLRREQLRNVVVLDRQPEGSEGVWSNFARMHTLRTHKRASGLDFGNPLLTPQAWYVAQHGEAAWEKMEKIPRDTWHDYLKWYRRVLDLPVRNNAHVVLMGPAGDHIKLSLEDGSELLARKVILATGLDGCGRWFLPAIASQLPSHRYAHTEDAIDFSALRGARVGVLGGGASAFDNAGAALEAGAASVDLCIRLPRFPRINPNKWMETSGFLGHYYRLPDAERWAFMQQIGSMNQPPPQETLYRCTSHDNFTLRTNSPWLQVRETASGVAVRTPAAELEFDFLIFGTGTVNDVRQRPELAGIVDEIATWADRYQPPPAEADEALSRAPYLGPSFVFTEKRPGHAPFLRNIHAFNFGATPSQGLSAASISGMKFGIRRLIDGVVRDLFLEDSAWQLQSLKQYADPEIVNFRPGMTFDEWEAAQDAPALAP